MRLLVWLVVGLIVLLALAQVVLPRIAVSRIGSRVGRYGKVQSVSVSAWPAVELLWGHVGSVHVRAESLSLSPAQAASLLWEAKGTANMNVSAESVQVGSLRLTDASLHKRGSCPDSGSSDERSGREGGACRKGLACELLRSEGGEVEVQATGGLFGVGASVNAVAGASDGALVAHPWASSLKACS